METELHQAIDSGFTDPALIRSHDSDASLEPASRGSFGSVIGRALVGERLTGTIVHVAEASYDNGSLGAFNASQQLATGCLTAPFKALALVLAILFAPFRFLIGLGFSGRGHSGPTDVQIPIHRFRLQADTGQMVECVLRGQLAGGGIYLGEDVEVSGKFSLTTGVFNVQRVVSHSTGAVTTGSVDFRVRYQWVLLVIMAIIVITVIYTLWSFLT